MELSKIVALARLHYHANLVDINNVLNQLHIITDEIAEKRNKHHVMIVVNDIAWRINNNRE